MGRTAPATPKRISALDEFYGTLDPQALLRDLPGWVGPGSARVMGDGSICFQCLSKEGRVSNQVRCDAIFFAALLELTLFGQTAFIDNSVRADATEGYEYLKVFGDVPNSAGIDAARIVAEVEEGEQIRFLSEDTLDIRSSNLEIVPSGRAKRDMMDTLKHALPSDAAVAERLGLTWESYKNRVIRVLRSLPPVKRRKKAER
jgi:hypothetical protein